MMKMSAFSRLLGCRIVIRLLLSKANKTALSRSDSEMIIIIKNRCNKTASRYLHTMNPAPVQHCLPLMHTDKPRRAPAIQWQLIKTRAYFHARLLQNLSRASWAAGKFPLPDQMGGNQHRGHHCRKRRFGWTGRRMPGIEKLEAQYRV